MTVAKVPISKTVLVGQSLGTAVIAGAADRYTKDHNGSFAGLILVAGFSDLATLLLTYSTGGVLPILSPLRFYPRLQNWLLKQLHESWRTQDSLKRLVARAEELDLTIIHAKNDCNIPWSHSGVLFHAAINGTSDERLVGFSNKQIDSLKRYEERGREGHTNSWHAAGKDGRGILRIRQEVADYGGACSSHHSLLLS